MSLTQLAVDECAGLLLDARTRRMRMSDWPEHLRPADQHDAERICEAMAGGFEAPIGGWKVGAMDPAIAVKRGLTRPFCGQIPASLIYPSGAQVVWRDLLRPVVEAEIVFRLGASLPSRSAPYTAAQIADAVDAVIPAIEIPESRLIDGHPLGALGMVADQGFAGRLVLGEPVTDWRGLDLGKCAVRMRIGKDDDRGGGRAGDFSGRGEDDAHAGGARTVEGNGAADDLPKGLRTLMDSGASEVSGHGARAMGNPFHALEWLVDFRRLRGDGLKAGQVVSTGSLTGVQGTAQGDRVSAEFDFLGCVFLRMN